MAPRTAVRRLVPGLLAAVLGMAALLPLPATTPPPAAAGGEALPDLAVAPLDDFQVQWVNGRRMLRFTAMMVNVGDGHFEVRGQRSSTSEPMRVRQVIYTDASRNTVARTITTGAEGRWSGDGHDHWHVQEMMRYDLWGTNGTTRGAKVGFCFLDSDPWRLSLPGAPSGSYYRGSWCGNSPSALSNRMGISVGWGDEYEWYLAWQWIDITGMPSGTYTVRANVDPYGFFVETDEANQCAWARVSISASSNGVPVQARGTECLNDWTDSKFADAIAWMWSSGITAGCSSDLYCTNNTVLRDQMATFLTRAKDLPPAGRDYFTDDAGNRHEDRINRLAASGITSGCDATRFCPNGAVTRGQMASFLARAFALPPADRDYFTDDAGSKHESNINRLAAAGLTFGCGGTRFCPDGLVTRGQMAAFLYRAFN
ncbi:MAG TPA: S-layer homology domain-containing protein [Candidatus Angelobacter sp.]|nr:S-layer homology domain-containing protein [Candidatus Angelobacter sp.]